MQGITPSTLPGELGNCLGRNCRKLICQNFMQRLFYSLAEFNRDYAPGLATTGKGVLGCLEESIIAQISMNLSANKLSSNFSNKLSIHSLGTGYLKAMELMEPRPAPPGSGGPVKKS
jgi:hypothetical protein